MTAFNILSGIYVTDKSDFGISLPINREPVIQETGLSHAYLRPSPGIAGLASGPGADRGGINWNEQLYRVLGTSLCLIDEYGGVTVLGDVGGSEPVSMDYSFDRLAIASNRQLFYWDGTSLTQVTDPDLGPVLDVLFIDGYFMTTDGTSIVVTDLNDPYSVNPLKYGSAEADPDPIVGLKIVQGEVLALGRNTIQIFQNTGGVTGSGLDAKAGFPFVNVSGAVIPRGCVGTHASAYFLESVAFVGSGRNEAPGVYLAGGGSSQKLSNSEVDSALNALSKDEQASIEVEARVDRDEQRLSIHLPSCTYVFHQAASKRLSRSVWTRVASGTGFDRRYRGRHASFCYGKWIVGDDDGNVGALDYSLNTHFGEIAGWQFDAGLIAAPGGRAIVQAIELIGIMGEAPFGERPVVFNSYTLDGRTWSQERAASPGRSGQRSTILQWRGGRRVNRWMGLRFRGADGGMASYTGLDLQVEALR